MAGPSDRGEGDGGTSLRGSSGREGGGDQSISFNAKGGQTYADVCFSKSSCCFVKSFQRCVGQMRLLSWHDSWFANVALLYLAKMQFSSPENKESKGNSEQDREER